MPLSTIDSYGLTQTNWTTAGRPSSPFVGQIGYNTTYGGMEVYNGSAWDTITGGPAFQTSISSGTTQSVSATTFTKIQFNTVAFDTNSNFNASTYRFTPTIPGYYQLNVFCGVSTPCRVITALIQNGSTYYYGMDSGSANVGSSMNSMVMKFNGSTDYVEAFIYLSTGQNLANGVTATGFNGSFIRSI